VSGLKGQSVRHELKKQNTQAPNVRGGRRGVFHQNFRSSVCDMGKVGSIVLPRGERTIGSAPTQERTETVREGEVAKPDVVVLVQPDVSGPQILKDYVTIIVEILEGGEQLHKDQSRLCLSHGPLTSKDIAKAPIRWPFQREVNIFARIDDFVQARNEGVEGVGQTCEFSLERRSAERIIDAKTLEADIKTGEFVSGNENGRAVSDKGGAEDVILADSERRGGACGHRQSKPGEFYLQNFCVPLSFSSIAFVIAQQSFLRVNDENLDYRL
jgi:hypothetical protein